jgi:formamidopyrimidine-DNA glycosylase
MPELPEIEIVKRSLNKMINHAKIINVKVKNKNLRYQLPNNFNKKLVNEKILKISRRSKYLIFHFRKKILLIHLGMTGKLLLMKKNNKEMFKTSFYYDLNIISKHNHVYFILNNGYILIYNDVRRFGFIKFYKNININNIIFLKKLGVEPLNKFFNTIYFQKFIKNKKKNIKNLLMDQKFVSGVGNIYANEALFMSKINPSRLSSDLKKEEIKKLISCIKNILKFSILKGGSSIRDFKNPSGKIGDFQSFFKVYGKENKNCSRISCKGKIKRISISSRSSFYCNTCQK